MRQLLPEVLTNSYLKRFAFVTLIVLAATAGIGLFFQQQVTADLEEQTRTELEGMAVDQANSVERWLTENKRTTLMMARADGLALEDSQEVQATLEIELNSVPDEHLALHYVDTETGEVLSSTEDSAEGVNINDRVVWRTAADEDGELKFENTRDVIFTEVYKVDGQGRLAFATPIPGADGKTLINVVDPKAIAENFRQPYAGSHESIVGVHGDIQADADSANLRTKYDNQAIIESAHQGESGVTLNEETGDFVVYAPVEGTQRPGTDAAADWVVAIEVPTESALAVSRTVQRDIFIIIGAALLGFVVLGLTIGRNTVQAVRRVSNSAEAIAAGDLNAEIDETSRNDEVGDLVRSFQGMQEYLSVTAEQAAAIADQRFDDPVLEREVPGTFGETLDRMADDVEQAQRDAEQARKEAEALNDHLQDKAGEFSTRMGKAAEGDFTQRMDPASQSSAMTDIAEAFNAMMNELSETFTQIQSFADEVATSSEEVTIGTDETKSASEQVSESIQEISADAEIQSESIQEVASETQNLSGTVEEVASSAEEIAETSERAANLGREGQDAATEAMDEMAAIETQSEETVAEIESLADEIDEIGEIVELITEIAEQTNILALNASIEAARAGEAGEGFAVVASEIKELAGEVGDATDEVETLIEGIQSSTTNAVADIQEMGDRVSSGTETIEEALNSLDEIATNVEEVNQSIQAVSTATDDQASSTEEVASMVDEVADAAEQINSESENVSAAAEEQASSLTEVAQSSQTLANQADELQQLLSQFTLDTEPAASESEPGTAAGSTTAADGGIETDR